MPGAWQRSRLTYHVNAALMVVIVATGCTENARTGVGPTEGQKYRVVASVDSTTLQAGDSLGVTAAIFDETGARVTGELIWHVPTPALLQYENGTVRTFEEGQGRIVVTARSAADTIRITITPRARMTAHLSRVLAAHEWAYVTVAGGRVIRGEASYSFESSDSSVVSVSDDGRVFARTAGTAEVTVRRTFLNGTRGDTAVLPVRVEPASPLLPRMSVEFTGGFVPTTLEARLIGQAIQRWQNVIVRPPQLMFSALLPPRSGGACNPTDQAVGRTIEGLRIFVRLLPDSLAAPGVGGYGGWCAVDSDGYPRFLGVDLVEQFVRNFRAKQLPPDYFEAVMVHEIGHGMGVVHLIPFGRPGHRIALPDGTWGFTGPNTLAAYRALTKQTAATFVPLSTDGYHFSSKLNSPDIREALAGGGRISALSLGVISDQGSPVRLERAEGPPPPLPGAKPPSIWY